MFYKNIMFTMAMFWFGFESSFSGQTLFDGMLYQAWNLLFTAIPIIWWACHDHQHNKSEYMEEPSLYRIGLRDEGLNFFVFLWTFIEAAGQAMVLVYIVFEGIDHFTQSVQGRTGSFWVDGTNVNAAIVIVCNTKVLYETNTHTW